MARSFLGKITDQGSSNIHDVIRSVLNFLIFFFFFFLQKDLTSTKKRKTAYVYVYKKRV